MHEVPPRHEPVKYLPQRLYEFSRRYSALLQTAVPDPSLGLPTLLQELSRLLHGIFDFNFISYSLADSSLKVSQLHILDTNGALEKPIELSQLSTVLRSVSGVYQLSELEKLSSVG